MLDSGAAWGGGGRAGSGDQLLMQTTTRGCGISGDPAEVFRRG